MVKKNSYKDLKNNYPDYIIIQKAGCFYDVRDFGAIFLSEQLGFTIYSDRSALYKIGFPIASFDTVIETIRNYNYKYLVTEYYQIVDKYDAGINIPTFNVVKSTPETELIEKKNETTDLKYILSDDEKLELKNLIKEYRHTILNGANLPVYCAFTNKEIEQLLKYLPRNVEILKTIPGFKKKRIDKYGTGIITIINNFLDKKLEIKSISREKDLETKEQDYLATVNGIVSDNIDINIVFECIKKHDGKFSYKGIAKILTGYFGFRFIPGMRDSKYYGYYKNCNVDAIEKVLDYLIEQNYIIDDYKIKINYKNTNTNRTQHEIILKKIFGHIAFKDWQWNVINQLLNNKKILSIEKTGGGKSLCFQYLSEYFYSQNKGVTIVFSPLQALMREQVQYLKSIGIKAECIITTNNTQSDINQKHKAIYERIVNNDVAILYIAPERLNNKLWMEYSSKFKIAMIVIDEAHCISTWGHDFRIDYRRIIELTRILPPTIPVLALTATANNIVASDIQEQIGEMRVIRGSLERSNLFLNVIKTLNLKEKFVYLKNFVNMHDGHGIVYVGTQADTKLFSDWLNYVGIKSSYYHAGLSDEKRRELEIALKNNEYKVIVSTNALGMGMDKRDVRFVVHTQIPSSLIAYYQEIGRAGRDGLNATILLLYNDDDEDLQKYFIDTSKPSRKHYINTLNCLKKADLGLYNLIRLVNVRKPTMKLILKDLEDKGHIEHLSNLQYTYIRDMSEEEFELINKYKQIRYDDLAKMLEYVHLTSCRTKFICDYLSDNLTQNCNHCDNCVPKLSINLLKEDFQLLDNFFENYFIYQETENCCIVSSGYYKIEEVGKLIKDSKYRNKGYFAESLLERTIRAYNKYYYNKHFDYILFVPPSISGDLVENFAMRISYKLGICLKKDIIKVKQTDMPLKEVQSRLKKRDLLKGVFKLNNSEIYHNKRILLIDDIIDSGVTVDEISKILLNNGVLEVCVLTIAKTTVGDE